MEFNRRKLLFITFAAVMICLAVAFLIWKFWISDSETRPIEIINTNSSQIAVNSANKINGNLPALIQKDTKLQTQADSLLKLFGKMPSVPVYLKDEPVLNIGSETQRGLAYAICEPGNKPTIFVKKVFYEKNNQKQITNILKHELTHAWFCRQGIKAEHDERFRKKFESIGGFGN